MLQDALARGALSLAQLQQWLRLAATPVIGQLCRWVPAFRRALQPALQACAMHRGECSHAALAEAYFFHAGIG